MRQHLHTFIADSGRDFAKFVLEQAEQATARIEAQEGVASTRSALVAEQERIATERIRQAGLNLVSVGERLEVVNVRMDDTGTRLGEMEGQIRIRNQEVKLVSEKVANQDAQLANEVKWAEAVNKRVGAGFFFALCAAGVPILPG